jgi:hypothetical protein
VARKVQMPRKTASGAVPSPYGERFVDGEYCGSASLLRLRPLLQQPTEIHAIAKPVLQELSRETGETARNWLC